MTGSSEKSQIGVAGYGLTTAAGAGVDPLWQGLQNKKHFVRNVETSSWPVAPVFAPKAALWPDRMPLASAREQIGRQLNQAWSQIQLSAPFYKEKYGVILASTKGCVEDQVWSDATDPIDPLDILLQDFLSATDLCPEWTAVVSNACSSALSALWLAQKWIEQGRVRSVVIVAADMVGPFVLHGFHTLHALSTSLAKPFDQTRDGLQLGEAAAVIVVSDISSVSQQRDLIFRGAGIDTEGFAVTRPTPSGESLERAIAQISAAGSPDLIIAHGTGTALNDPAEDAVFAKAFASSRPWITGSKGAIGHTLGASGAVDFILACEALCREAVFPLVNTQTVDPQFHGRYVINGPLDMSLKSVLVSSLGFGGIHAAAMVGLR